MLSFHIQYIFYVNIEQLERQSRAVLFSSHDNSLNLEFTVWHSMLLLLVNFFGMKECSRFCRQHQNPADYHRK